MVGKCVGQKLVRMGAYSYRDMSKNENVLIIAPPTGENHFTSFESMVKIWCLCDLCCPSRFAGEK